MKSGSAYSTLGMFLNLATIFSTLCPGGMETTWTSIPGITFVVLVLLAAWSSDILAPALNFTRMRSGTNSPECSGADIASLHQLTNKSAVIQKTKVTSTPKKFALFIFLTPLYL
jgi:hypothetical protein